MHIKGPPRCGDLDGSEKRKEAEGMFKNMEKRYLLGK